VHKTDADLICHYHFVHWHTYDACRSLFTTIFSWMGARSVPETWQVDPGRQWRRNTQITLSLGSELYTQAASSATNCIKLTLPRLTWQTPNVNYNIGTVRVTRVAFNSWSGDPWINAQVSKYDVRGSSLSSSRIAFDYHRYDTMIYELGKNGNVYCLWYTHGHPAYIDSIIFQDMVPSPSAPAIKVAGYFPLLIFSSLQSWYVANCKLPSLLNL